MAWEYIELNICPIGDKPVFHAAQYDIGRPIIIKLKNGEDDFTPTDLDIELQVRKVDNNVVTAVPDSVDGNVVTFLTTEQMTACSGTNLCEVQLTTGDNTMATLHFYLVVQRDALQGGLSSQSEIHDLEDQIAAIVPEVIGDEYYTAAQVDELIDDIPTFDPSNYYDKTQLYTKTETNGLLAQKANTSALSTVAFTGSYDDLIDHPVIPDVSDYYTKEETYSQNEVNTLLGAKADTSSLAAVATSGDYDDLTNKPTIPAAQVNSDWNSTSGVSEILNKPTVYQNAAALPISANDSTDTKTYIDTGLSTVESNAFPNYWSLFSDQNASNTIKTLNVVSGRKISDFTFLFAIVIRGFGERASSFIPIGKFRTGTWVSLTEVDSANTQRWYEVKYVDDTHVTVQCSSNAEGSEVHIYGIGTTATYS